MTAQEAARYTEDSVCHGMRKIYEIIRKAGGDNYVHEIFIRRENIGSEQINILRRRGYHVDETAVEDGRKAKGVLVSWDPKVIGDERIN